jgi:hypothetical protein
MEGFKGKCPIKFRMPWRLFPDNKIDSISGAAKASLTV